MRKPLNSSVPENLIREMDEVVGASRGRYANRSHFVQVAIRRLIDDEREPTTPAKNR